MEIEKDIEIYISTHGTLLFNQMFIVPTNFNHRCNIKLYGLPGFVTNLCSKHNILNGKCINFKSGDLMLDIIISFTHDIDIHDFITRDNEIITEKLDKPIKKKAKEFFKDIETSEIYRVDKENSSGYYTLSLFCYRLNLLFPSRNINVHLISCLNKDEYFKYISGSEEHTKTNIKLIDNLIELNKNEDATYRRSKIIKSSFLNQFMKNFKFEDGKNAYYFDYNEISIYDPYTINNFLKNFDKIQFKPDGINFIYLYDDEGKEIGYLDVDSDSRSKYNSVNLVGDAKTLVDSGIKSKEDYIGYEPNHNKTENYTRIENYIRIEYIRKIDIRLFPHNIHDVEKYKIKDSFTVFTDKIHDEKQDYETLTSEIRDKIIESIETFEDIVGKVKKNG